jgi:hypothetical protein
MSEDALAAYRSRDAKRHAKESWKRLMREAVVLTCDQVIGKPIDPTHALNLASEVQAEFDRLFMEQQFTRREQTKFYGRQLEIEGFIAQYAPMAPAAQASVPEREDCRAYKICNADVW